MQEHSDKVTISKSRKRGLRRNQPRKKIKRKKKPAYEHLGLPASQNLRE
jgi:hypothetical protein